MPTQPDDDDDIPHQDDTLMTPYTSKQAGPFQLKQQGKKPKGSSELLSVRKEALLADRAQEDDMRKTVQELVKTPDARQAWAAWFASVCQDVPQERFREFQHETFTVSMRYLQQSSQQQPQQQPMWQSQTQQPRWQPPNAPGPVAAWAESSQPPQHHHLQLLQPQPRSYTPTQDVQGCAVRGQPHQVTSGRSQPSRHPTSYNRPSPTASTLRPSQYQPSSQPSSAEPQPAQQSADPGSSLSLSPGLSSGQQDSSLE